MNLTGINESINLDNFRALEFDLCEILCRHNHVLLRFELITFDDLFASENLAAFLALFLIANGPVILLVQLIKTDRFFCVYGVVNPNRNGNERKSDVSLPYRSHNSPRLD